MELGDLFPSHDRADFPDGQHPGEPIASVVSLINSTSGQALDYNAFTSQQIAGVTTFALPRVSKQSRDGASHVVKESNGVTSMIAIRNNSDCSGDVGRVYLPIVLKNEAAYAP